MRFVVFLPPHIYARLCLGVRQSGWIENLPNTNLNITVLEKRMLRQSEAATYAGLAAKHFATLCPVRPIELQPGRKLWDRQDLDAWIDGVKSDSSNFTRETILKRLK